MVAQVSGKLVWTAVAAASLVLLVPTFSVSSEKTADLAAGAMVEVAASELMLRPEEGLVYHRGVPFTGRSHRRYANGQLAERIHYLRGKRHGLREQWFEDSSKSFVCDYVSGKRHGVTRTWWRNGNLRSESRFERGVPHGIQMQWYASGAKLKRIQLEHGKESGLQQSWRDNGKIYNNYEARDGRVFGLKRSKLCYQLDDEKLQTKQP